MTKMQTNCTTTLGKVNTPISTAVAWREKKSKHFVFYKHFCLITAKLLLLRLIRLFAREVLLVKNLEIEEAKTT